MCAYTSILSTVLFLSRIGIKLPDTEGLGVVDKADKLLDLYMFLHEKGKFTFHSYVF